MNGSTVAQAIYANFVQAAQAALQQAVGPMLAAVAIVVAGAIGLQVVIQGTALATGGASLPSVVRKIATGIIVAALTGQGIFNQFVSTTLTQTIPNIIAQAVSGGLNGHSIAQAYDGLMNFVTNQGAQIRAQMVGIAYIGDRVAEWVVEALTKLFIIASFVVYGLAAASMFVTIPVIIALLWTWVFDRTRAWGERSVGFAGGLLLVQMIALMLSAFTVHAEATFFQQAGHTIAATTSLNSFSMNSGDVAFTGFGEANPGLAGDQAIAPGGSTINTSASMVSMISALCVTLFGFALLSVSTRMAYGIMASSGLSAAPVVNMATTVMTMPARMASRMASRR